MKIPQPTFACHHCTKQCDIPLSKLCNDCFKLTRERIWEGFYDTPGHRCDRNRQSGRTLAKIRELYENDGASLVVHSSYYAGGLKEIYRAVAMRILSPASSPHDFARAKPLLIDHTIADFGMTERFRALPNARC